MSRMVWRFSGFEYSHAEGLRRGGAQITLGPQARQLLELLLEAKGDVVPKAAIAARLWPERDPSDDSIDRCVYLLRKPLRDAGFGDLIATAYGRGLSLRAKVEIVDFASEPEPQFGRSIDERILDLWQTAFELAGARTRVGFERAHAAILSAGELEPRAPRIWTLSAHIAATRVVYGLLPASQGAAMIERDAGRALEVEPEFGPALAVLGWARAAVLRRVDEGLAMLDGVVSRDPGHSKARAYRSWALAQDNRLAEAAEDAELGLRNAPLDQGLLSMRAWLALNAGDIDGGAELTRRGLILRPDSRWLLGVAALAASLSGRHADAEDFARRGLGFIPDDPVLLAVLSYGLAVAGRPAAADAALAAAAAGGGRPFLFTAAAVLARGRASEAIDALARGRAEGCPWFAFAPYDPRPAPLRGEIARMGATAPQILPNG
jgi:DNA-binding winged helix-turn-helix (wHTH) protein